MTEHSAPLEKISSDLDALKRRAQFRALGGYDPYPFQVHFHRRKSGKWVNGHFEPSVPPAPARQILLSAGNQAGKTEGGGSDVAIHATGEYPEWWDFAEYPNMTEKLREYPLIWCGGSNNDKVRDIGQAALCGDPNDPEAWGTGWIPKERLEGRVLKAGVKNAFDLLTVRHKAGFLVTIGFKSYDSSLLDWAGEAVALIWLDEEPPQHIYSQCLARTTASGGTIAMTFTPEKGATEVVSGFMTNLKPGQAMLLVGLDDAMHEDGRTHLVKEVRDQLETAYMPHERDMRIRGLPVLGSGAVYSLAIETIICKPFPILESMPRLCALDFGSGGKNHPTAAVWLVFDLDSNTCWVYDCYKSWATEPSVHAQAVRSRGEWIPVAWPHDGHRKEAYATDGVAREYRAMGLRLLGTHATNEDGSTVIEPGLFKIYRAMLEGRFFVFPHLIAWQEEFRMYHRDEGGTIVDLKDDLMSATRIGYLMKRYAIPAGEQNRRRPTIATGTNDYDPTEGV